MAEEKKLAYDEDLKPVIPVLKRCCGEVLLEGGFVKGDTKAVPDTHTGDDHTILHHAMTIWKHKY